MHSFRALLEKNALIIFKNQMPTASETVRFDCIDQLVIAFKDIIDVCYENHTKPIH
jgi:uncharacterized glyoxalase superfamily metalloenzyme YdcJ